MRSLFAAFAFAATLAHAQATKSPDLQLRGDRFKPLSYDELTPEQKKLADDVLAGERGSLGGPYNVLLRSPEMGNLAQKFGASMRFHSSLPKKLNEFAIILTARFWGSEYEWYAHKRAALMAGLDPKIVDAVAAGARPAGMQADEETLYNFAKEMLDTHQVSDRTFQEAKARWGEKGVVDLVGVMGYYHLVSMLLNLDRYPLPDGVKPELKPLTK